MNKNLLPFIKQLANGSKLLIIDALQDEYMFGLDLAEKLGLGYSNISRSLKQLSEAGILEAVPEGAAIKYRVRSLDIFIALEQLQYVADDCKRHE